MRLGLLLAAVAATVAGIAGAHASGDEDVGPRQVYCYAFAMAEGDKLIRLVTRRTLFVSPIFESSEDDVYLEVAYRQSIPEAGLATCVSEEYEPDLAAAWKQFVDISRDDGTPVVIAPLPVD